MRRARPASGMTLFVTLQRGAQPLTRATYRACVPELSCQVVNTSHHPPCRPGNWLLI
jgi:hypothetical protein